MKKLHYQTFRERYRFSRSTQTPLPKRELKKAIKLCQDKILRNLDLYLEHGLMDDWHLRPGGYLGGPYTDFEIVEIEDWGFWSSFELEGEECIRVWFTTP